jgi:hypothetical protein
MVVTAANADFVAAVRRRASQSALVWVTEIHVIDITSALSLDGARFVVDDHPTRLGHAAIASELDATIESENRQTVVPDRIESI